MNGGSREVWVCRNEWTHELTLHLQRLYRYRSRFCLIRLWLDLASLFEHESFSSPAQLADVQQHELRNEYDHLYHHHLFVFEFVTFLWVGDDPKGINSPEQGRIVWHPLALNCHTDNSRFDASGMYNTLSTASIFFLFMILWTIESARVYCSSVHYRVTLCRCVKEVKAWRGRSLDWICFHSPWYVGNFIYTWGRYIKIRNNISWQENVLTSIIVIIWRLISMLFIIMITMWVAVCVCANFTRAAEGCWTCGDADLCNAVFSFTKRRLS